jgi:c-di-GMP-binding flagellar brake protein YcgR
MLGYNRHYSLIMARYRLRCKYLMTKEIILTIEKIHKYDESKFLISSAREIQLVLQAIAKNKSYVNLYFDNEEHFLKTLLLCANEKGIWLDTSQNEAENASLLKSESYTLVTMHNGAKVQLTCHHAVVAVYAGQPAFFFPLPTRIMRVQRRDFFRISLPTDVPLNCVIPPVPEKTNNQQLAIIMDISLGGIALKCRESNVRLEEGVLYPDCQIELPEIGTLIATIQVRHLFDVHTPSGDVIKHAGCEFVRLDSKMSMLLQRYIAVMQSRLSGIR